MTGQGAHTYQRVGAYSGVSCASAHQLILLLFDGALEAVRLAAAAMRSGDVAAKCRAIGKAVRIVDEGLKASLDRKAGGQLAFRLLDLYDYVTMRLLQANLRNDESALDEVLRLLADLRGAWARIAPQPQQAPAVPSEAPVRRVAVAA